MGGQKNCSSNPNKSDAVPVVLTQYEELHSSAGMLEKTGKNWPCVDFNP